MKKFMIFSIVLMICVLFIIGCGSKKPVETPQNTTIIPPTPTISCSDFNSNPELWYRKSKTTTEYFVYFPVRDFHNENYTIGDEQIQNEERLLNDKNRIIATYGKICAFGSGVGQNMNNLYCKEQIFSLKEHDGEGVIKSIKSVKISVIFSADKAAEREETKAGTFTKVEDASIVEQTCKKTAK
jgi:hypothetical protein